ncbi:hypothetical protein [Adhaeribacter rhizoryzae]|uniref:DUF3876 domain-containing protein n=1 Tax=Adhaeribacter rhizoryzae TaxID=2607907 RepID=A0A5M6CUJ3_9BACT|nr:hypothetical protein [Adhaeribacter rhizoryzae]KAA5538733.1 hypothetical protein F0145_25665 [Adhaeribacter rhizoryzae]
MLKLIPVILLAFLCVSCSNVDCKGIAESRRSKYCNIVVREAPVSGRWFEIKGINPETKEESTYSDMETWYVQFYKNIQVGDTVVKKQGELEFFIHKKDTVLVYPYECEGKIYN